MNNVVELFKQQPEEEAVGKAKYSAKNVLRLLLYSVAIEDHDTAVTCFGRLAMQLDDAEDLKVPDSIKEKIDNIKEAELLNYVTKHV